MMPVRTKAMFGSDRIQTRFRGLETSSLVGVAPGYFSVASATALLLSFTALQYRQRGTFEQSNVTGLGHRVFLRILLGRCSHVGARRKQRVLCGRCLPLPFARREQRELCGRCLPLPWPGGSRECWIFLNHKRHFLLDWPVTSWSVVKSKAYPAHPCVS